MTPFEQKVREYREGKVALPSVNYQGKEVDPMGYQLAVVKFQLGLYAAGMLPTRGWKVTPIKKFFGLQGRDRKSLLTQFEALYESYRRGDIGE